MKIICIGRNYLDHTIELNNKVPKEPLFFLKPQTAIQPKNHPFFIPDFSNHIEHEVEIVIRINKLGKHIEEKFAHRYFNEIGLGIDFTARDIQNECKKNGLPWEKAKSFDGSAKISSKFINKSKIDIFNLNFSLKKNNLIVQKGNSCDMIFNYYNIISYVSKFCTLKIGDLIFTGTPAGVGKVNAGDILEGYIFDEKVLKVSVK